MVRTRIGFSAPHTQTHTPIRAKILNKQMNKLYNLQFLRFENELNNK